MSTIISITDDVFRKELDDSLKRQKVKIKQRQEIIKLALYSPVEERDELLEFEASKAREYERKTKEDKHIPSEFKEQCDFVAWFKASFPNVVIMSIRNGGHRTAAERVEQILEGLHPGAADLFIPEWHTWIEFKKIKGGVLSEKQEVFRDYVVEKCGDSWFLALGCQDGIKKITEYVAQNNIK